MYCVLCMYKYTYFIYLLCTRDRKCLYARMRSGGMAAACARIANIHDVCVCVCDDAIYSSVVFLNGLEHSPSVSVCVCVSLSVLHLCVCVV